MLVITALSIVVTEIVKGTTTLLFGDGTTFEYTVPKKVAVNDGYVQTE